MGTGRAESAGLSLCQVDDPLLAHVSLHTLQHHVFSRMDSTAAASIRRRQLDARQKGVCLSGE